MADSRVTTKSLKIDTIFVDEDTRAITLKNPKANITTEEIQTLNAYLQQNNALIGDKTAATFGRITKVTTITKETTYYDI